MLRARVAHALRRVSDAAFVASAGRAASRVGDAAAVRRWESWRELASRYDVDVRTVLYVGANLGQEAELLLRAYPNAVVHCFEPQVRCQPALQDLARRWGDRVEVHPIALSDATGEVELTLPTTHGQAASLLTPNAEMEQRFPHVSGWRGQTAQALRLDDWAAERQLASDVLVKLDVQGAELMVARGGEQTLSNARLLVLEVAVVPTYEGAPEVSTVFETLLASGWGYAGEMGQVRDGQNAVVEFDAAFARPATAV